MKLPTVPLCQCRQCKKRYMHRRYIGRYREVQRRNRQIRYQKPDIMRMTKEEIENREVRLPRTGRYTD